MNANRNIGISPRLSLAMIVRNEESFLHDCLKSVADSADELIVVDTGSTDATVSIALAFGASIANVQWCDDFSAARNVALAHATGDWVLYLDADERLDPGQGPAIRTLLANPQAGAYRVAVYGEESVGGEAQRHRTEYPRLFRRKPGVMFEGRIHEQIGPSLERAGLKILNSDITIHHVGYAQSEDVLHMKAERNLRILRSAVEEDHSNWYLRAQLGSTLNNLRMFEEAEIEINAALDNNSVPRGVRAALFNTLGETRAGRGNWTGAVEAYRQSMSDAPRQITARWQLAGLYASRGEVRAAIDMLDDLTGLIGHGRPDIVHDIVVSDSEIRCKLGLLSELAGDTERAMRELLLAVTTAPEMGEAWAGIARLHRIGGRAVDAWNAVNLGLARQPGEAALYVLAARWSMEEHNTTEIEHIFQEADIHRVSSVDLAKLSLEFALKSHDLERARQSVEILKQLLPPDNEPMRRRLDSISERLFSILPSKSSH